jgi:hypothetical protein
VANRPALPSAPHLLGYAGLLPQAVAAVALASGSPDYRFSALALAFAYAALILSFLGALWWGLAGAQPDVAPSWIWVAGVLPSLIALATCVPWAVGAEWPVPSLWILAAAIAASPLVDLRLDRLGLCSAGWLRLRLILSASLAGLTAFCALA